MKHHELQVAEYRGKNPAFDPRYYNALIVLSLRGDATALRQIAEAYAYSVEKVAADVKFVQEKFVQEKSSNDTNDTSA